VKIAAKMDVASPTELSLKLMRMGRIDYGSHRKGGYPIGSGGIESAHRFICHARLKRSGAWWYVENGNRMLALRCADYNGTFERVFQKYVQKDQVSRIS